MEQGEIILYQPDEAVRLEVRLEDETVWLTQAQIVDLFQSSKANISEHIKNIYDQKELEESSTVRDFRTVRQEGKRQVMRNLTYYNLVIISANRYHFYHSNSTISITQSVPKLSVNQYHS